MLFLFLTLSLFLPNTLPATTPPPSATSPESTTTISATSHRNPAWHDFHNLLDAGKGRRFTGLSNLKTYMQHFGYLNVQDANHSDEFDDGFETAVAGYQSKHHLPATGKLNAATISEMTSPRCGVRDIPPPNSHAVQRYSYFDGKTRWSRALPTTLTYSFSPTYKVSNLKLSDVRAIFRRAFSRWSTVIPVNFTETPYYGFSDIKIGFYSGDHDDGEPFDGVLGVLAHGFSPESGRLHLDAAETWAVDFSSEKSAVAVDLESVATHEIGHVLGLAHSFVKESVMYPNLKPRKQKLDLKADDVQGIQQLYGSNPNFKMGALSQDDMSFNDATDSKKGSWTWSVAVTMVMLVVVGVYS